MQFFTYQIWKFSNILIFSAYEGVAKNETENKAIAIGKIYQKLQNESI